jgi:hypothetical protein
LDGSIQIQTSVINTSIEEVYQKTSNLLTQIQNHADQGCSHCLELLKSGLREPTSPEPTFVVQHQLTGPDTNEP